jgi:cadmium resistance protein CadD (predicted permease)
VPELLLDMLTGVILACIAYAATNFDNLLLLNVLSQSPDDARSTRTGFVLASGMVLLLASAFSVLGLVVPLHWLGYLGIVPITIGIFGLLRRADEQAAQNIRNATPAAVMLILLSNSADTIAVFGPLFAETELAAGLALVAGFVAMAATWLRLVPHIRNRLRQSATLERLVHRATPWLMIAIGCYVFADTWTDRV